MDLLSRFVQRKGEEIPVVNHEILDEVGALMAKKIAIILGVFVGFYLAAHYYIRWKNTVTDNVTKVKKIIPCEPNQIVGLKIGSKDAPTMEIRRVDQPTPGAPPALQFEQSEWKILGEHKMEAEQALTTGIVAKVCEIYDPIPVREEEYVRLGGAKVTLLAVGSVEGSESTWSMEFTDLGQDRLVVMKLSEGGESPKYYKTAAKLSQLISLPPKDFINTRLMRMPADAINRMSVGLAKGKSFRLERNGEGWDLYEGEKQLGSGSDEAIRFVNRFTTLKAIDVNYGELNPNVCDPDKGTATVQIEGLNNRVELLSFQYGKAGPIKACNSQREAIFSIHRDFLPFLETPVKKMLGGTKEK